MHKIAYEARIGRPNDGYGSHRYAHFEIDVLAGSILDAAVQYNHDPSQYYLERLQTIRELGSSTKYFDSFSDSRICTLSWQSDPDAWGQERHADSPEWYAGGVQRAKLTKASVQFFSRLIKAGAGEDTDPRKTLDALHGMNAIHVGSPSGVPYACYIIQEDQYDPSKLDVNPFVTPEATSELIAAS